MYPQAQAYVSMLSSMAQVGTMPTPVMDPEELVSAVDALVAAEARFDAHAKNGAARRRPRCEETGA